MASTFDPSFQGIGEMLRADFIQAEMQRRAGKGMEFAVSTAPFDPHSKDGTHYKEQFRVDARPRVDRACAALVNDDPAAFQIEVGTSDTPAHRTMTRALDVMGQ